MEIDTNISIEIDEDEWAIELDLDGRIQEQIERFVDDDWIEKIVRQTIALNPDMVRDIVHEEITTASVPQLWGTHPQQRHAWPVPRGA